MGAFLREKPTARLLPEAALEPNEGNRGMDPRPLVLFAPLSSILISPSGLLRRSRSRDAPAAGDGAAAAPDAPRASPAPDAPRAAAAPAAARAAAAPGAARATAAAAAAAERV